MGALACYPETEFATRREEQKEAEERALTDEEIRRGCESGRYKRLDAEYPRDWSLHEGFCRKYGL